jgi:hypothetical protein
VVLDEDEEFVDIAGQVFGQVWPVP